MIIQNIQLYTILNSIGTTAIEVEMTSLEGYQTYASSPSAIIPGKRESKTTVTIDNRLLHKLTQELVNTELNQENLDNILKRYLNILGSDICLSISLAFARLNAIKEKCTLCTYISKQLSYNTKYKFPSPMVTLFSGGVHSHKKTIQNIMIVANTNSFSENIRITSDIYSHIEKYLNSHNILLGYGQSSGLITNSLNTKQKLELISEIICSKDDYNTKTSIALDIAAEHLLDSHKELYNLDGNFLTGSEMSSLLQQYINDFPISFVEDPFDSNDTELWKNFLSKNNNIQVVGDDLFATQCKFLDNQLANSIIIKMNQAGTLSETLKTIQQAKSLGMTFCVSHRSIETEDTFMCDLAVSMDANYIKIGGPRRGDRISKYNRMIRLERNLKP